MRSILCAFVLLFLHVGCMSAPRHDIKQYAREPCVISDRVGEFIDADEREYYDLFSSLIYIAPMTYRYKSATLHAAHGGGYAVRIATAEGTLVSLNNDLRGMAIITDYIDNYEEVKESRGAFEDKWGIVAYDMLNLPITAHEIELTKERLAAQGKSLRSSPVMAGAALGFIVGGATAFAIAWVSADTFDVSDPEWGCLAGMAKLGYASGIGCIGGLAGAVVGGLIGYGVRKTQSSRWSTTEDSAIIDLIKKQRIPNFVSMKD